MNDDTIEYPHDHREVSNTNPEVDHDSPLLQKQKKTILQIMDMPRSERRRIARLNGLKNIPSIVNIKLNQTNENSKVQSGSEDSVGTPDTGETPAGN